MNNLLVVFWISAYTIGLINLIIGFIVFLKRKEKSIFALLLILFHTFSITIFILLNNIFSNFNEFSFLILYNLSALFYITIPHFIFTVVKISIKTWKLIAGVILHLIVIDILFLIFHINLVQYLYYFFPVPFVALTFYINKNKQKNKQKIQPVKIISLFAFWDNISACGMMLGLLSFLCGIGFFAITLFSNEQDYNIINLYFIGFTLLYNTPSLIFFIKLISGQNKNTFNSNELYAKLELLGLSPRERDVAEKLINGMKYTEIGDTLCISLTTVKKHAYNIFRKVDVKNSRQLIQKTIQ